MRGLNQPYESLQDVIEGLRQIESALRGASDRRAIFATAYLNMTEEIAARVGDSRFQDPAWVARYALAFANLYRRALLSYESGDLPAVPKAWRASFEASQQRRVLLLQDLLLGINAHINRDLAFALDEAGIDPERDKRRADHTAVNDAVRQATDPVQDAITSRYAPALRLLERALGPLDEEITNFSIDKARFTAWISAVALANARDQAEREDASAAIEDRASVMAKLIMHPRLPARVVNSMHRIEATSSWTKLLRRNG